MKITHQDKIEARRLFLTLSKGRNAWADGRGQIIRGNELAALRHRAMHELVNLSTGPAGAAEQAKNRNSSAWNNTAQLLRMKKKVEGAGKNIISELWISAVHGNDIGSQSRARVMHRAIDRLAPDAPGRFEIPNTPEHYKERRHLEMSIRSKGRVTRRDIECGGEIVPKGTKAYVDGSTLFVTGGGTMKTLTPDDVRPMRKRDHLRLEKESQADLDPDFI